MAYHNVVRHAGFWKNHKYTSKKKVNGKWRYFYGKSGGSDSDYDPSSDKGRVGNIGGYRKNRGLPFGSGYTAYNNYSHDFNPSDRKAHDWYNAKVQASRNHEPTWRRQKPATWTKKERKLGYDKKQAFEDANLAYQTNKEFGQAHNQGTLQDLGTQSAVERNLGKRAQKFLKSYKKTAIYKMENARDSINKGKAKLKKLFGR